jgi:hypothetical protein
MSDRPACCVCPPGDCLSNPADPDALVCGVAGCSVCLHGCASPEACCLPHGEGVPSLPTPEIAAALGLQTVDPQHAATLSDEIDYLIADRASLRTQFAAVTAKYDAAMCRLHELAVLADNWDARATERSPDAAGRLRDCARELRAALDSGRDHGTLRGYGWGPI